MIQGIMYILIMVILLGLGAIAMQSPENQELWELRYSEMRTLLFVGGELEKDIPDKDIKSNLNSITISDFQRKSVQYKIDENYPIERYNDTCFKTLIANKTKILSSTSLSLADLTKLNSNKIPYETSKTKVDYDYTKENILCHNEIVGHYKWGFNSSEVIVTMSGLGVYNTTVYNPTNGSVQLDRVNKTITLDFNDIDDDLTLEQVAAITRYSFQLKFDSSSIPSGSIINDCNLSVEVQDEPANFDPTVEDVSRIAVSEPWDDNSNAATMEAQTKLNAVASQFVPAVFTNGARNLINCTSQLQASIDASEATFSIRVETANMGTIDGVIDDAEYIFGNDGGGNDNYVDFHSSGAAADADKPQMIISYSLPVYNGTYITPVINLSSNGSVKTVNNISWRNDTPVGTNISVSVRTKNITFNDTDLVYWAGLDNDYGSSLVDDYSSNNFYGTIVDTPIFRNNGTISGAYDFDGADDYIAIPSNTVTSAIDGTQATVMAWIHVDAIDETNDNKIVSGRFVDANECGLGLDINNGDEFRLISCTSALVTSVFPFSDTGHVGTWVHIVGVYNGTHISLYINGTQRDADAQTGNIGWSSVTPTVNIGAEFTTGAEDFFNGMIDEVRYWNRSMKADEILDIYNREFQGKNGNWTQYTPRNYTNPTIFTDNQVNGTHTQAKFYYEGDGSYTPSLYNYTIGYSDFISGVVGDTCDCSSIQAGTTIDCSENCDISACDASGQNLYFFGTGVITISGDITNHGKPTSRGTDSSNRCTVRCLGGCFK